MNCVIVSIGDELILGQTVDTNAAWLSVELAALGIVVSEHVTVADDVGLVAAHLRRTAAAADVVLLTGGLGPTDDDITRQALAVALGQKLQLHEPSLEQIKEFFARRGRKMSPRNRIQAMIPSGCEVLDNELGTAPGMCARIGKGWAFFLPGVPVEMKNMFRHCVLDRLCRMRQGESPHDVIITRTLHTVGGGRVRHCPTAGRYDGARA